MAVLALAGIGEQHVAGKDFAVGQVHQSGIGAALHRTRR